MTAATKLLGSSKINNRRIVSGMRSTGRLHLGNYHGALKNWLKLQHEYECFFFAADWHALTTHYNNTSEVESHTWQMLQDWLACGLDPNLAKIFIQSSIAEHAELHLLLSMIVPTSWLERVPTYKDQKEKLKEMDLSNYGFLGYPVLQSADVLIYKAGYVPVGEDQVAHLELTREIARRFNFIYGDKILPEPQPLLTATSKMPGLDGQKMSKSYNNTISLTEDAKSLEKKIKTMPTDPARVRRSDPGDPEKCPVWGLHEVYSSDEVKSWVQKGCITAGIGCIDCKKHLIDTVESEIKPIRERSDEYKRDINILKKIVKNSSEEVRNIARDTLQDVRSAMGISYND